MEAFLILCSVSLHMNCLDGLHSILNKLQRTSKKKRKEKKQQLDVCTVIATDLMFPSEDISIHITIKHNVAPGNVYIKS